MGLNLETALVCRWDVIGVLNCLHSLAVFLSDRDFWETNQAFDAEATLHSHTDEVQS